MANLLGLLRFARNDGVSWKSMLLALSLLLTGCEELSVLNTPAKTNVPSSSALSIKAESQFWEVLHRGEYSKIPEVTHLMMAAYLENPNDAVLAAHLGFLYTWKITERERNQAVAQDPLVVNNIILAKKYFSDAITLNPGDPRYQGFFGDTLLIEGQIFNDQREQTRGYFKLRSAINQWPEFNYFTAGYPMSILEAHSSLFQEALGWQWKTLTLCAGRKINQQNPNFSPYLNKETQIGPQRACWNSWIAPHNFEGFFMNMGDMLTKEGDWKTAIQIYQNARLSKTYQDWPYRKMLEDRILHVKENSVKFKENKTILFNSGVGCVVCHQK